MLDLRKLLLAVAAIMILSASAFAQTPLSCTAQAAGTPSIRAEGLTELVGDILINCSGGTPTLEGQPIPQVNIQVATSGPSITSRTLGTGSTSSRFTEALLFIDEPGPSTQTLCGSPIAPENTNQPGVCSKNLGLWDGATFPPPDVYNGGVNRPNSWLGQKIPTGSGFLPNSLIWVGVQFDPPGTSRNRTIRITNVRVNANFAGIPNQGLGQGVQIFISTQASGIGELGEPTPPGIQLPIANPTPTVAFIQKSLVFSASNTSGLQCNPETKTTSLTYRELFPSAWRRRSAATTTDSEVSPAPETSDTFVNVYVPESGFYKASANSNRWSSPWGQVAGNPGAGNIASPPIVGLADHGTRLIAHFTNVQAGVRVRVSTLVNLTEITTGATTGFMRLISAGDPGSGPFSPVTGSGLSTVVGASDSNRNGVAVWEILSTNTNLFEIASPTVEYNWSPDLTNGRPALGTSGGDGGYAPISSVTTSSYSAPIPRFTNALTQVNPLLTVNTCRSNLLWPFVTNTNGFDTGFAISNTTEDPFDTQIQTGACKIYFYGDVGGSQLHGVNYPTKAITGGEHLLFSLSSGGDIPAVAGFKGYVIARCDFQYAHGYGFISDLGSQKFAQGYLALVLDEDFAMNQLLSDHGLGTDQGRRTGSVSEAINQ